jgi:hypothetical protein
MDKITTMNNQKKSQVLFNTFIPSLLNLVVYGRKMPLAAQPKQVSLYEIAGRAPARIGFLEVIRNLQIGILNAMHFAQCPLRS